MRVKASNTGSATSSPQPFDQLTGFQRIDHAMAECGVMGESRLADRSAQ
jgi:hypothetical protein